MEGLCDWEKDANGFNKCIANNCGLASCTISMNNECMDMPFCIISSHNYEYFHQYKIHK
jgi:hypothetical protein